jgi:hypothetical protein
MRTALRNRLTTCLLLVILPGSLLAADNGAAMIYTNRTTYDVVQKGDYGTFVNGTGIPKSSAIFPGDMIQTRPDALAHIITTGTNVIVFYDSLIEYQGDKIKIDRGGMTVATSKGVSLQAGEVTIRPALNAQTDFEVTDNDGTLRVVAHKGDLLIADEASTVTLAQGQETTRDDSAASTDPNKKKKKKKRAAAAAPAAAGSIMDSPWVIYGGIGVVGGVTTWILLKGDDPISPSSPTQQQSAP